MEDACNVVDAVQDEDFEIFHAMNRENDEDSEVFKEEKKRFVIPKDFELLKVIGMGSFGKVLSVRSKKNDKIYAMKIISKRLIRKKSGYIENIQMERNILTKLRHPFVVTMHCAFQSKEKLFLIMDFCSGGELFLRIGLEGIFSEEETSFYVAEIILALEYLHQRHVLHRDLKPENILLNGDGHICITDFGLAKDFTSLNSSEEFATTICGTGEYMAPEMIAKKGYGKAADYWSLGCITYEMLSGLPPFQSKKGTKDLFRKILNERIKMPTASGKAHRLLKGLLTRDSTKRLGASKTTMFHVGGVSELKSQDFFGDIDFVRLEDKQFEPPIHLEPVEEYGHFHEDFVNMALPRSVKEMCAGRQGNRRVHSDTFKGFSFIQDDFHLPERDDQEHDAYWETLDSEAESLSECASSKVMDDTASVGSHLTGSTAPKKRPPRKKKKKNQSTIPEKEEEKKSGEEEKIIQQISNITIQEFPAQIEEKKKNDKEKKFPAERLKQTLDKTPNTPTAPTMPTAWQKSPAKPTKVAELTKAIPEKPMESAWQTISAKKEPRKKQVHIVKNGWTKQSSNSSQTNTPSKSQWASKTVMSSSRPSLREENPFWPSLDSPSISTKKNVQPVLKGAWAKR